MNSFKISEGLVSGALDQLVKQTISIDEYESKISDKRAIVCGFFVTDEDPANDLARFIDRSSIPLLDVEISPAPTPDGYYVVWAELGRNDEFPKNVMNLRDDITKLCDNDKWSFTCPGVADELDLTIDNLEKSIVCDQSTYLKKHPDSDQAEQLDTETPTDKGDLKEFWRNSSVDAVAIDEDEVSLIKDGVAHSYRLVNVPAGLVSHSLFESQGSRVLQALLGPGYSVYGSDDLLTVEHYRGGIVCLSSD